MALGAQLGTSTLLVREWVVRVRWIWDGKVGPTLITKGFFCRTSGYRCFTGTERNSLCWPWPSLGAEEGGVGSEKDISQCLPRPSLHWKCRQVKTASVGAGARFAVWPHSFRSLPQLFRPRFFPHKLTVKPPGTSRTLSNRW